MQIDFMLVETNVVVLTFGVVTTICKHFKIINPKQAIQYTWNKFHDNNRYTNWLDIYKYVTKAYVYNCGLFWVVNVVSYVSLKETIKVT